MMLTAILCTARREPQFQWMADSLTYALNIAECDFELIVVDKLLWPDHDDINDLWNDQITYRQWQLEKAIKGRFSYRHVSPKPSPWQGPWRKTQRDFYDLNGARNTALCLARGSHVVFFDDCSVLDENFLAAHARAAQRGMAVCGSFESYTKAKVESGRSIEGELHPHGKDSRGGMTQKGHGAWMWGLNVSFPLEWALKINGYDEMYSGQGGSDDCDFGVRLERAGCPLVFMPDCLIYQILETHEPVCEINTWGEPQKVPQKEKILPSDGKLHFANEYAIWELLQDSTRTLPRGNEFNLRELRERVLKDGYSAFPTTFNLTHDWRDGAKLEDCK